MLQSYSEFLVVCFNELLPLSDLLLGDLVGIMSHQLPNSASHISGQLSLDELSINAHHQHHQDKH